MRSSIARAGRLRRPAALPPSANPQPARDLQAPTPPRRPRAPRQSPPAPPARPSWIARWFGRGRRQPAWSASSLFPAGNDAPFTPEAYPGFPPELCAILNTPAEDCDPELLRLVLAVFARHLADNLPSELGLDAEALLSTLCGRLGASLDEAGPDAAPAEEADEAPGSTADAMPAEALSSPHDLTEIQAASLPVDAAIGGVPAAAPHTKILPKPGLYDSRSPRRSWRPRIHGCRNLVSRGFRNRQRRLCCRQRAVLPVCRGHSNRQPAPPLRRLCYAACAGPP